jgi:SET family sugar efflux transporter-like MFS transporter
MHNLAQVARSPALRLSAMAMLFLGMQNASIGPYVSLIAIERVGLSEGAFSLVLMVGAVVAVVSAVLMGVMGDQRGRRRGIALIAALASLLGIALMVAAPSPLALVMCHAILLPLGSSLYGQVFALARLANTAAPAQGQDAILGTVRAGMSISFMLMLVFWTFAFGAGVDVMWTYTAALIAAALLVALIAAQWPVGSNVLWQDRPSGQTMRAALAELARPAVALRLVILGTISASFMIYFILIGLVFEESPLRGAADVALYVGMVAGWEVPLLMLLPRLLVYVSRSALIAVGAGFYALHIIMMPIWVDTPWLWLGTLVAGIGGTASIGLTIGYYQDLLLGRPGAAGAMLALQKLVADLLGAAGFALGMAVGGYQTVAVIGFCLTVGGAIALWLADRNAWLVPKAAQNM